MKYVGYACSSGSGCVWSRGVHARVNPPKQVTEPERVWLLQFPIHPALVFQTEPGVFVMYEYGEWAWFAEQKTSKMRFFPVFLWPTQGSLSRRELTLPDSHKQQYTGGGFPCRESLGNGC